MEEIRCESTETIIKKEYMFRDIVAFLESRYDDDIWIYNGYYSSYNHTMNIIGASHKDKKSKLFEIPMGLFSIYIGADIISIVFDYSTETLTIKYKAYGGKK